MNKLFKNVKFYAMVWLRFAVEGENILMQHPVLKIKSPCPHENTVYVVENIKKISVESFLRKQKKVEDRKNI